VPVTPPFTVTIGLALSEPGDAFSAAVARADNAMLSAKGLGRDRVMAVGDTVAVAPATPFPREAATTSVRASSGV